MKQEILKLLHESSEYLSGQELAGRFCVSRTAVWKAIKSLEEDGYVIRAVRNKGYRLVESPDRLTKDSILAAGYDWPGGELHVFDVTDSTNIRADALGSAGAPSGTLVVAEQQDSGKGRRGRSWKSPAGTGIYMSLLLRPQIDPNRASMLTLVTALAVSRGIDEFCGIETQIKWPNDVIISGKKVVGILTELRAEADYISHVVIGTGINVNNESFPAEVEQTATSLFLETGKRVDRSGLLVNCIACFREIYEQVIEAGSLAPCRREYEERLVNVGRKVRVLDPKGEFGGTAHGITDSGELIVEKEDGIIENIYAGEVSVRGVYGYV